MASAKYTRTTAQNQELHTLFRDPFVSAAFWRAGRDSGTAFAIPATPRPVLPQGAEVAHETA
ncbi:hypothetical protein ACFOM8_01955 [Paracoccus angustae]|uniref:Uncharacterized protein n=1 Tax=Paracoccus angustae TaxID=1671480 RepID=A0ABV7TZH4_9RHOB